MDRESFCSGILFSPMAPPAPQLITFLLRVARTPSLLIGMCCVVVFYAVCFPIMNTDIWWHLATGRWMVQQGAVPRVDLFSLGTLGSPWIDVHWLFQLFSYTVYQLGDLQGLVLVKALLCAISALILALATQGARAPYGAVLAPLTIAVTFFGARHLVLARPIIITLLCLSATLFILEQFCHGRHARVLWWLAPVQLLWANCQGLFLLGPGLVGIYFLGEWLTLLAHRPFNAGRPDQASKESEPDQCGEGSRIWWLGAAALGLLICSTATPFGLEGLLLPFKLLSRIEPGAGELFRLNVTENIPPWIMAREGGALGPLMWVAVMTCASFLLRGRHLRFSHLLATATFLALALLANRNVLLFFWLAGFVLAVNLSPLIQTLFQSRRDEAVLPQPPTWLAAVTLAVLLLLGTQRFVEARAEPPLNQLAPFRVPTKAVQLLKDQCALPPGSNIFNSVRYGGYLIWELFPRNRPFIDGRLVIRTAQQFAQHLALADGTGDFAAFAQAHQIKAVLLPAAYPDRYLPLVRSLYLDVRWTLVFTDGTQTLFLAANQVNPGCHAVNLNSRETVRGIVKDLQRIWALQPLIQQQALLHLARLLAEVGELGHAQEVLEGESSLSAQTLLARVYYLNGDKTRAEKMAGHQLARHPTDVGSLTLLAQIAVDRGERRHALDLLQRALEQDPFDDQARQLLTLLQQDPAVP